MDGGPMSPYPPHLHTMHNLAKAMQSLIDEIEEHCTINDLRQQYGLDEEEISGYIEYFAANKIKKLSTVFGDQNEIE